MLWHNIEETLTADSTTSSDVKLKDIKRNGSDKWLSELQPQPQQL